VQHCAARECEAPRSLTDPTFPTRARQAVHGDWCIERERGNEPGPVPAKYDEGSCYVGNRVDRHRTLKRQQKPPAAPPLWPQHERGRQKTSEQGEDLQGKDHGADWESRLHTGKRLWQQRADVRPHALERNRFFRVVNDEEDGRPHYDRAPRQTAASRMRRVVK
jgi:hypothetical protein